VEEGILDWIKENEVLYNKGNEGWKDTGKRKALWATKAEQIGITATELSTWFLSLRTKFGKLTKDKSGDGAKRFTDRDKWILTNLAFLKVHIFRVPSRVGVSVSCFKLSCNRGSSGIFKFVALCSQTDNMSGNFYFCADINFQPNFKQI
jgi:hypothetical protein